MEAGFDQGVAAGGLRDRYQVNILIMYLLRSIKTPLTMEDLQFACLEDELTNYFELTGALEELIQIDQIQELTLSDRTIAYQLTKKGEDRTDLLLRDLPKSVRDRALQNIMELLRQKSSSSKIFSSVTKVDDGYLVKLILPDLGSDLMDLTLFAPDLNSAKSIESSFKASPENLYRGIWALLTGNYDTMGSLIPKDNK